MEQYSFKCNTLKAEFSVEAETRNKAYELANNYFMPKYTNQGLQFYGWMGEGKCVYSSFGTWD